MQHAMHGLHAFRMLHASVKNGVKNIILELLEKISDCRQHPDGSKTLQNAYFTEIYSVEITCLGFKGTSAKISLMFSRI